MNRFSIAVCTLLFAAVSAGAQTLNLKAPIADKPALLTSSGQSADIEMVKVLLDRAKLPYKMDAKIAAPALAGTGAKSLVLVLGGSSKGLGQAKGGTDQELARVKALLQKAKAAKIPVMALHIGGESRRGPLSDPFISPVAGQCDQVVVLAGGNKDKLFTRLTQTNRVPLHEAQDYKALVARIGAAWGKEAPAAAKSPAAAKPPAKAPGAGK